MFSKLKQLLEYYWAQMKAAQTTLAAMTMKAELMASSLVQQMDDMTEKMMDCSLVASLAKKSEEMMVMMTDY